MTLCLCFNTKSLNLQFSTSIPAFIDTIILPLPISKDFSLVTVLYGQYFLLDYFTLTIHSLKGNQRYMLLNDTTHVVACWWLGTSICDLTISHPTIERASRRSYWNSNCVMKTLLFQISNWKFPHMMSVCSF